MATTYARIRTALGQMRARTWAPEELKKALIDRDKTRNEHTFSRRDGARKFEPFSDGAFSRLFALMAELSLIERTADEKLAIEKTTAGSLAEDKRFQELITRRVIGYLEEHGATLPKIRAVTQTIQLPEVRDAETILSRLQKDGHAKKISPANFSRLLFLMACAKNRAARHMKIFYEFP